MNSGSQIPSIPAATVTPCEFTCTLSPRLRTTRNSRNNVLVNLKEAHISLVETYENFTSMLPDQIMPRNFFLEWGLFQKAFSTFSRLTSRIINSNTSFVGDAVSNAAGELVNTIGAFIVELNAAEIAKLTPHKTQSELVLREIDNNMLQFESCLEKVNYKTNTPLQAYNQILNQFVMFEKNLNEGFKAYPFDYELGRALVMALRGVTTDISDMVDKKLARFLKEMPHVRQVQRNLNGSIARLSAITVAAVDHDTHMRSLRNALAQFSTQLNACNSKLNLPFKIETDFEC